MKLKKGSKAALEFMAKVRASRGTKKKLSGTKKKAVKKLTAKAKNIHTNVKISGAGDYAKFEISTIKALAKLLKKPLKTTQKAVYDNKNLLDLISFNFDQGTTAIKTAKILKDYLIPKKQIKPLDAFVNLLTKKGKGQSSTGSKANFPMKLPATVTIGNLSNSMLSEISQKIDMLDKWKSVYITLQYEYKKAPKQLKGAIRTDIHRVKKVIADYKSQITKLKKHI